MSRAALLVGIMSLHAFAHPAYSEVLGANLERLSAAEIVELLESRDAQFDNAMCEYTTNRVDSSFRSSLSSSPLGFRHSSWNKTIIVRGNELTIKGNRTSYEHKGDYFVPDEIGEFYPNYQGPPTIPIKTIWTNRGKGVVEVQLSSSQHGTVDANMPGSYIDSGEYCLALAEMSFGFGFGSRIRTSQAIAVNSAIASLKGTIEIDKDTYGYVLEVDSLLIVRQATLTSTRPGPIKQYKFLTQGIYEMPGGLFKCAASGSCTDSRVSPNPAEDYRITCAITKITPQLIDAQYEQVTSFTIPRNALIQDPYNLVRER